MTEEQTNAIIEAIKKAVIAEIISAQLQLDENIRKIMRELPKNCSMCKLRKDGLYGHNGQFLCRGCMDEVELYEMFAL